MTKLLNLYRMANEKGIPVDCFELEKRESLAIMDSDGTCYVAIDPFKLTSSQDELEKLAHELGHCFTGSFYNQYATYDIRQKHENRADRWAIRQLIPWDDLEAAISAGFTERWELAELFDVSEDLVRKAISYYTGPCGLSFQKNLPESC